MLTLSRKFSVECALVAAQCGASNPTRIFEIIKDFRSAAAIEHYRMTFGLSESEAEEHFVEVLKYLSIAASYPGKATPSTQLDEAWHSLVIQTRDYQVLCRKIGKFIHHSTTEAPRQQQYDGALSLYRRHFGVLHSVWTMPLKKRAKQDCQTCETVGWCSDGD